MDQQPSTFIKPAISIRLSELEGLLDQQIPDVLFDSEAAAEGQNIDIKATKSGAVKLAAEGNTIHYRVPIRIAVRKDIGISEATANCEMMMGFKTDFLILPDWSLRTKTDIVQYGWIKKPILKLGIVTFPVETILLNILHSKKKLICDSIDQQITENTNLNQLIPLTLGNLPNPIVAPFVGKIWWWASPVSTYLDPLYVENKALEITFGLKSNVALGIGKPLTTNPLEINAPDFTESLRSPSNLQVHTQVALATLQKIANEQLAEKRLPIEQFELIPKNIQVQSEGEKLVVKSDLSGGFTGNATIKAIPVYNNSKKTIDFKDITLDLEGKGIKSKGIALMASSILLEQLNQHLKIPLKPMIKNLNSFINKNEIQPGIFLKSYITDYDIKDVKIDPETIGFQLSAEGLISVKVEKLAISDSNA